MNLNAKYCLEIQIQKLIQSLPQVREFRESRIRQRSQENVSDFYKKYWEKLNF